MPADEVTHGTEVDKSRVRTGPRHAAPRKPLFTRFHMPAGKAIAMAAMPTAVLMGMGFTSTLAIADSNSPATPTAKSLTADEYKDCVAALEGAKGDASASPTPSPSASDGATDDKDDKGDTAPTPSPSATPGGSGGSGDDGSTAPDSGSGDKDEPKPTPSATAPAEGGDDAAATPSPSPSESGGNLLEDIGDAIGGIFDGGNKDGASPSPSASASEGTEKAVGNASGTVKESTEKVAGTVEDTAKGTTDKASKTVEDTGKTVEDTTEAAEKAVREAAEKAKEASASPTPSPSSTTNPEDCPAATDAEGGVDNELLVPDDPWYLEASSLKLHGADYKGVVEVKTASGATKKVLKFVISDGTEIGDLHQLVKDKQSGKTHHVQAAKGSTSTITGGKTVMYTEKISGNLLGFVPLTFDPEHPPPLNLPEIYFTNVKVTQAGQFGGTLTVPGLHQYVTG
ncbi:hypothetical protein ABZ322_03420 [Streptomyces sp. NPDC006129]|uniref:hypothetical protein n=1 Tax=Streptomyces sp. NPDC006129 TaxID=3155348 RepID=UPI0033A95F8D